jgi:hypothetical protein
VIRSRDVIVDKRVGSKPESEFGIDPVEAPGREPGNGEPVGVIQTPAKDAHREVESWIQGVDLHDLRRRLIRARRRVRS